MIETSGATIANNSETLCQRAPAFRSVTSSCTSQPQPNSIQTILPGYADPFRADGGRFPLAPPLLYDE